MDANNPNYPIPIRKLPDHGYPFCKALPDHGYPFCKAIHYREVRAGRLTTTKIRGRTFVLKKHADRWLKNWVAAAGGPIEKQLTA
jgi:hypothetical protein